MIKSEIVADSVCAETGKRLTTFVIEYPRFILAELNTHRMLGKNSSSSRAIPINTILKAILTNPAMPVHWGKNKSGMQADGELSKFRQKLGKAAWVAGAYLAVSVSWVLSKIGTHKQVANRVTEPYQWMRTVITGTEWENLWWLRNHPDAQPEFKALVEMMQREYESVEPKVLSKGEWHTPFYRDGFWSAVEGGEVDKYGYKLEEALKISVSCAAQTSFRRNDDTLEKAVRIYGMLNIGSETEPMHASPAEHQGTPMGKDIELIEFGVTAKHKQLGYMSGNLAGWIQFRQLFQHNTKW